MDPTAIPDVNAKAHIKPIVSITFIFPLPALGPKAIKPAVAKPLVADIKNILTKGNQSLLNADPPLSYATIKADAINIPLTKTNIY